MRRSAQVGLGFVVALGIANMAVLFGQGGSKAGASRPVIRAVSLSVDFRLPDSRGHLIEVAAKPGRPVVLLFCDDRTCPDANHLVAFRDLCSAYVRDPAASIYIILSGSRVADSLLAQQISEKYREAGLGARILLDAGGEVSAAFGLSRGAVVIAPDGRIACRGGWSSRDSARQAAAECQNTMAALAPRRDDSFTQAFGVSRGVPK